MKSQVIQWTQGEMLWSVRINKKDPYQCTDPKDQFQGKLLPYGSDAFHC